MSMKKIIAAALAAAMMLSLASCANKEDADDKDCIYGKISSADGNDIVLQLAEYKQSSDSEAGDDTDSKAEDDTSRSGKSGRSNRP